MANDEKQKQFIAELKQVFEKYGVYLDNSDQYDGEENYCGTDWSIQGEGIYIDIWDLNREVS